MFAELLAAPGVEEHLVLRSQVGFMALHGGALEPGTAEIATEAAAHAKASSYTVVQPEGLSWHIPSPQIDPAESEALGRFLEHVDTVVSVHGYGWEDRLRAVLVGGANRELAVVVADALRVALPDYRVVDDLEAMPSRMRGVHPRNPVNRSRAGGVQLELPPILRREPSPARSALASTLAALFVQTDCP